MHASVFVRLISVHLATAQHRLLLLCSVAARATLQPGDSIGTKQQHRGLLMRGCSAIWEGQSAAVNVRYQAVGTPTQAGDRLHKHAPVHCVSNTLAEYVIPL